MRKQLSQVSRIDRISTPWCNKYRSSPQRCSLKKMFWKYEADLQENNHAEFTAMFSCKFAAYFQNVFS